jgi:2-C-methyl-D-erythritol 4-phosphate cytidylyltransferase
MTAACSVAHFALIVAAGVGARMGSTVPKQYLVLQGQPVLWHTAQVFLDSRAIDHVFIVVSEQDGFVEQVFAPDTERLTILRCGGATRQASVLNGLRAMHPVPQANDWVLVHDAARPGLTGELLQGLQQAVENHPVGGLLALPVADTVKQVQGDRVRTLEREGLWLAQTPQMFRYAMLQQAMQQAEGKFAVSDEASAIEALGHAPMLVPGAAANFKLTLPSDLVLMDAMLTAANKG